MSVIYADAILTKSHTLPKEVTPPQIEIDRMRNISRKCGRCRSSKVLAETCQNKPGFDISVRLFFRIYESGCGGCLLKA